MTAGGLRSLPEGGQAVVFGATGTIGAAVAAALHDSGRFAVVHEFSRRSDPAILFPEEAGIEAAAARINEAGLPLRLVFVATGFLHDDRHQPEKSWRAMSAEGLAHAFAINTIGPALIARHFLPLIPREGKAVFAALSAKVGSITDNGYGGWYGYRASKAALNQIIRTASIELARRRPEAVVAALHPGTVESPLSAPFSRTGLRVRDGATAAADLLAVIDGMSAENTGEFRSWDGSLLPW